MSSLIKVLYNPKTPTYIEIKNFILSINFPWHWNLKSTGDLNASGYDNFGFYAHAFLERPEQLQNKIPCPRSEYLNSVSNAILEILSFNNIEVNSFLRICANSVHPSNKILNSVPHVDHHFDHKNIILYLTNSGGSTIVGDESYNPSEDNVILFDGKTHYMQTPEKERRVILIATFV